MHHQRISHRTDESVDPEKTPPRILDDCKERGLKTWVVNGSISVIELILLPFRFSLYCIMRRKGRILTEKFSYITHNKLLLLSLFYSFLCPITDLSFLASTTDSRSVGRSVFFS
jgi:hypothetical protein